MVAAQTASTLTFRPHSSPKTVAAKVDLLPFNIKYSYENPHFNAI